MANNANIYVVVVKGKVDGQDYRNVMHFGGDTNANDGAWEPILLQLAQAVFECFVTVLLPGLSSQISIDECTAKRIYPAVTDEVSYSTGAASGAGSGQALPSFCSVKVELKTGSGGRRNRGRLFLPPPLETEVQNSIFAANGNVLFTSFLVCIAGKFIGAAPSTGFALGVLSRAAVKGGSTIQAAFKPVTSYVISNVIGVMRRRKLGTGS
jgi:hypothetical protein